ncbi:MAG: hypothetical protein ACRC6O_13290 [Flavobacterium sp.]
MTNKLPNSLEIEINKFLEGFNPQHLIFTEEGLKEVENHYNRLKDEDVNLFNIKHYLAMAITTNNLNKLEND